MMTRPASEGPPGTCFLCREDEDDIMAHLRLLHPDVWEGIERWPDGGPVVYDLTVRTPGDIVNIEREL